MNEYLRDYVHATDGLTYAEVELAATRRKTALRYLWPHLCLEDAQRLLIGDNELFEHIRKTTAFLRLVREIAQGGAGGSLLGSLMALIPPSETLTLWALLSLFALCAILVLGIAKAEAHFSARRFCDIQLVENQQCQQ